MQPSVEDTDPGQARPLECVPERLHLVLLCLTLSLGVALRIMFFVQITERTEEFDLAGDPCHHYNIAHNIYRGIGPCTTFMFSYWPQHETLPALTDVYPPVPHFIWAAAMFIIGPGFFAARMASLASSIAILFLAYGLARSITGRWPALFALLLIAFNDTQIRMSSLVMTPSIVTAMWTAATILLVYNFRGRFNGIALGVLSGLAHMTQPFGPALAVAYIGGTWQYSKRLRLSVRETVHKALPFVAAVVLTLGPWAVATYSYFGQPLYAVTNVSFMSPDWRTMTCTASPPTMDEFLESNSAFGLATFAVNGWKSLMIDLIDNLIPARNILRIRFAKNINLLRSFMCFVVVVGVVDALRQRRGAGIVLLFLAGVLGMLFIASFPFEGLTKSRNLMMPATFVAIPFGSGVICLATMAMNAVSMVRPGLRKTSAYVCVGILFMGVPYKLQEYSQRSIQKFGPWATFNIHAPEFRQAAKWIRDNTANDASFMYGVVPQDLAVLTERHVYFDPTSWPDIDAFELGAVIIRKYQIDYYVSNFANEVYDQGDFPGRGALLRRFPGIQLEEVYLSDSGRLAVFAIEPETQVPSNE